MVCLIFFINIFGLLQVSVSPKLFLIFWTTELYLQNSMKHTLSSSQRLKIPQK